MWEEEEEEEGKERAVLNGERESERDEMRDKDSGAECERGKVKQCTI